MAAWELRVFRLGVPDCEFRPDRRGVDMLCCDAPCFAVLLDQRKNHV